MHATNLVVQPRPPQVPKQIELEFVPGTANTLWVTMAKAQEGARQNFSLPLLSGLEEALRKVKDADVTWHHDGHAHPVHYAVLKSGHPEYYSLGGDLEHFHSCILRKDRKALHSYSKFCLDIMYQWATILNHRATTIALVQGRALGGGFETALSADFLIAEEQSEFGFPEIMFGLFPCTGGMSLLSRRIGVHAAERMMTNGRIYSAADLKEMGVVDEICPQGEGVQAVERFIGAHARRRIARLFLQRSRYRISPLDYAELLTVVDEWVEAAMELGQDDLRAMEMLIQLQRAA